MPTTGFTDSQQTDVDMDSQVTDVDTFRQDVGEKVILPQIMYTNQLFFYNQVLYEFFKFIKSKSLTFITIPPDTLQTIDDTQVFIPTLVTNSNAMNLTSPIEKVNSFLIDQNHLLFSCINMVPWNATDHQELLNNLQHSLSVLPDF